MRLLKALFGTLSVIWVLLMGLLGFICAYVIWAVADSGYPKVALVSAVILALAAAGIGLAVKAFFKFVNAATPQGADQSANGSTNGRRRVVCPRCSKGQNIRLEETRYECWRCHEVVEI